MNLLSPRLVLVNWARMGVERIEDNTPYLYLDCGDVPTGVYQMILIVNEQIVAQSKLLKL